MIKLNAYTHTKFKIKSWIRVIKFHQNVWQKPYINMNTDPRKKAKTDFENFFF